MTRNDREVKPPLWQRALGWIDGHPRSGWYIAVVVTANFTLHLLQAFGVV